VFSPLVSLSRACLFIVNVTHRAVCTHKVAAISAPSSCSVFLLASVLLLPVLVRSKDLSELRMELSGPPPPPPPPVILMRKAAPCAHK
jgi:hypothetical protein